jgi:hypothetical protein
MVWGNVIAMQQLLMGCFAIETSRVVWVAEMMTGGSKTLQLLIHAVSVYIQVVHVPASEPGNLAYK